MSEVLAFSIPKDVENMQLPNPALRDYYQDEQRRVFWLEDEVGDDTLELVKVIMRLNHEDARASIPVENRVPIKIFIDTPGGDVQVMWSLMNAIRISKTPVHTIVFCNALSAGSYILSAGHKRFAFPGSTILVHSGYAGYQGTAEQVESAKKYFDRLSNTANDAFLKNTKVTPKFLKKKGAFDWYMSAEEALENGIVDAIIDDYSEVM